MASISVSPSVARPQATNRKTDRIFFSAMVLVLLATVLWGFARTYFLAGMVTAPLPNKLVHIHGAAFSLWMVLLIVQTALVAAHRVKLHMTLGLFGFGLAGAMIVLGLMAAVDAMHRGSGPLGLDAQTFFVVPVTSIVMFAGFILFAYRWRRNAEAHKRLILMATISLMDAAVNRWPVELFHQHPPLANLVILAFLLAIVVYDRLSLHRFSKTTLVASAILIIVHVVRIPVGLSAPWHAMTRAILRA